MPLAAQLRQVKLPVWYVGLESTLVTGLWGTTLLPDYGFADLLTDTACRLLVLAGPPAYVERLWGQTAVRRWVRFVLEGNYVAATAAAEPVVQSIVFPDWQAHYLPQGVLSVGAFGRLLIDYAWRGEPSEEPAGDEVV